MNKEKKATSAIIPPRFNTVGLCNETTRQPGQSEVKRDDVPSAF